MFLKKLALLTVGFISLCAPSILGANSGRSLCFLIFLFSALTTEAYAVDTAVFGPEWTFTSPKLIEMYRSSNEVSSDEAMRLYAQELIESWVEEIKRRCPNCSANWSAGDMVIRMSKDFWFSINLDQLVLEVNSSPGTISTFREHKNTLQSLVWGAASVIGLKPHFRFGGGHIHIDKQESFKSGWLRKSPNDFYKRNFLADILSSSEVFMGGLGFDLLNASGPSLYSLDTHRRLEVAFAEFDDLVIDYKELERRIVEEAYKEHAMIIIGSGARANQVLNLNHKDTYEIRGLRPQVSMDHFLLILELLQARINKAKTNQPRVLNSTPSATFFQVSTERLVQRYIVDVHPKRVKHKVVDYIESSGLDSELFKPYFTEELKGSLDSGSDVIDSALAEQPLKTGAIQCKRML